MTEPGFRDGPFVCLQRWKHIKGWLNSDYLPLTPDLKFLIELHTEKKTELQKEYIKWSTDKWIKSAPYHHEAFVINNFVRDWGHLFIYDEDTLKKAMEEAGFANITRYRVTESENDELKDLENEERMPKGFLQLESLILEGTKKAS